MFGRYWSKTGIQKNDALSTRKLSILVVTGDHDYDANEFEEMLASNCLHDAGIHRGSLQQ